MRVAIIGAGIAGNAAALSLHCGAAPVDVVVYEREARPGGHSATVEIDYEGARIAVDTGFMVYNEMNYPELTAMFAWLGVTTQSSDMSFSVSGDSGRFEWCGRDSSGDLFGVIDGLFACRRHLASPSFLALLVEILRFQRRAIADVRQGRVDSVSLGEYLLRNRFSKRLRDDYLAPMGAAIWSTSPAAMLQFPARTFLEFFDNHALLQWSRPRWRTVTGGSRVYVKKLIRASGERVRLGVTATRIERDAKGVTIADSQGGRERFDQVVIATHAPQALAMLADPSADERTILGACRTAANAVVLHRDSRFMPRRRSAWAAWNFMKNETSPDRAPTVTYWMNALQGIDGTRPLFLTLNPCSEPDPSLTFERFSYDHPQYDESALTAQDRLPRIQGLRRAWFCGAWTGNGFHEDGLRSGLSVAEALGGRTPWLDARPIRVAAE